MSPPDGRDEALGGEADGTELGPDQGDLFGTMVVEWLTTTGERVGTALVDSSVYLAVIAMAEVLIAMVLLSLPASPAPVVIALVTFAVYTNDHLVDDPTTSSRAAFVARYRSYLDPLAAVGYGLAVAIAALSGPAALVITLVPGLVWILYASGQLPLVGLRIRRLKRTLLVNTSIVALAWAVSLTFLPLAFTNRPLSWVVAVTVAYFFLRSLVDTIVPNIRDRDADRTAGISTIPVRYGLETTRRVLYGIDVLSALLIGVAAASGVLTLWLSVALLVGIAYSLVLTTLIDRGPAPETLAVATEFEYVLVGLALLPVIYTG